MSSHIHVREAEAKPKLHQALLVCERVVFGEAIRRNAPKTITFFDAREYTRARERSSLRCARRSCGSVRARRRALVPDSAHDRAARDRRHSHCE